MYLLFAENRLSEVVSGSIRNSTDLVRLTHKPERLPILAVRSVKLVTEVPLSPKYTRVSSQLSVNEA